MRLQTGESTLHLTHTEKGSCSSHVPRRTTTTTICSPIGPRGGIRCCAASLSPSRAQTQVAGHDPAYVSRQPFLGVLFVGAAQHAPFLDKTRHDEPQRDLIARVFFFFFFLNSEKHQPALLMCACCSQTAPTSSSGGGGGGRCSVCGRRHGDVIGCRSPERRVLRSATACKGQETRSSSVGVGQRAAARDTNGSRGGQGKKEEDGEEEEEEEEEEGEEGEEGEEEEEEEEEEDGEDNKEDGGGEPARQLYLDDSVKAVRKALCLFSASFGSDAKEVADIRSMLRELQDLQRDARGR